MIYNFKARISSELFYNYESYFGIYVFTTDDDIPHLKKSNNEYGKIFGMESIEEGFIAGQVQKLEPGLVYSVKAEIVTHKKYGFQYKPLQVMIEKPTTQDESLVFLQSFCTKKQARDIIDSYPDFIQRIIDGQTKFNLSIRDNKLNELVTQVQENYLSSDIMVMLTPLGITYKTIMKLVDDVPNKKVLLQMLEENPYILTKIHGLGFKKVDDIALKVNPELSTSEHRMKALVRYVLSDTANGEGHTIIPLSELRIEASSKTPECLEHFETVIDDKEFVIKIGSMIGLTMYYKNESYIYDKIRTLNSRCNVKALEEYDITKTEAKLGITFTEDQVQAIMSTNESDFSIISGSAGTGKTTVIQGVLDMFHGMEIGMCALAAKAAQRMTQITGHPAWTIHRLLKWNGSEFTYGKHNPLPYDLIIMDEASMVNSYLFRMLIEAIHRTETKFIIVFDHAQLPPIGAGNVAADLLKDMTLTRSRFTKIHRQAAKSGILLDANTIRRGHNPLKSSNDQTSGELKDMHYKFIKKADKEEMKFSIQNNIINSFFNAVSKYNLENVVIIVPRKTNAVNSTTEINKIIQDRMFDQYVPALYSGARKFCLGSRIIQKKNDYDNDVVNGEMGMVTRVSNDRKSMDIQFGPEKIINYTMNMIKNIELAYALTVHSYQGSQSDVVIIGLDFSHYILLDNCLLYTAITRAAKQCKIVADYKAYSFCISKNKNRERKTYMSKIINNELETFETNIMTKTIRGAFKEIIESE